MGSVQFYRRQILSTLFSYLIDGGTVRILTYGELKWRFKGVKIQELPVPRFTPLVLRYRALVLLDSNYTKLFLKKLNLASWHIDEFKNKIFWIVKVEKIHFISVLPISFQNVKYNYSRFVKKAIGDIESLNAYSIFQFKFSAL